jgi:hypothetical protein
MVDSAEKLQRVKSLKLKILAPIPSAIPHNLLSYNLRAVLTADIENRKDH